MPSIRIDGEIYDVTVSTGGYLDMVEDGRLEWFVAEDHEAADHATQRYWRELPASEILCLVGEERIVDMWASGTTLSEFVSDIPACEQWASYDGNESDIEPPTERERATAAAGVRWIVRVADGATGDDSPVYVIGDYATEAEAIRVAEELEEAVEGRECEVVAGFEGGDSDDMEALQVFISGWDELVEELGYAPTVAFRHN
jgi:hypothetical protein